MNYKNLRIGPVVVLEGPDGCGKSTLSGNFTKFNWNYAHFGAPDGPAYDFYRKGVQSLVGATVLDRYHTGSIVYGTIFRGTSDLTEFQHWLLEMELKSCSALMVHVTVPWENQVAVIKERRKTSDGDQFEAIDKQKAIRDKYAEVMEHTALEKVDFDWTRGDTFEKLFEVKLNRVLDAVVNRPEALFSSVPSLGWWEAPYVLVGDEPSTFASVKHMFDVHGVSLDRMRGVGGAPFNSTSGEYLYRSLQSAGIQNDVCIFNSRLIDGREIQDVWDSWPFPGTTIALGKKASERLERVGVEHVMVPHPQYMRRFHHKDIKLYGEMIRNARTQDDGSVPRRRLSDAA